MDFEKLLADLDTYLAKNGPRLQKDCVYRLHHAAEYAHAIAQSARWFAQGDTVTAAEYAELADSHRTRVLGP